MKFCCSRLYKKFKSVINHQAHPFGHRSNISTPLIHLLRTLGILGVRRGITSDEFSFSYRFFLFYFLRWAGTNSAIRVCDDTSARVTSSCPRASGHLYALFPASCDFGTRYGRFLPVFPQELRPTVVDTIIFYQQLVELWTRLHG